MLPYVVIHSAVSVDGRMDRLDVDMGLYYSLLPTWNEDLTLCGSETMLRADRGSWEHDKDHRPGPAAAGGGGWPGAVQELEEGRALSVLAGRDRSVLQVHS